MKALYWLRNLAALATICTVLVAQPTAENSLVFVQLPGAFNTDAVQLVWIPEAACKILPRENARGMPQWTFAFAPQPSHFHVPAPGRGPDALTTYPADMRPLGVC